jgi:hypothetical protein
MRTKGIHWFAPADLQFVAEIYIEWLQLDITKHNQVGRVGPEHKCDNDTRQAATRFL